MQDIIEISALGQAGFRIKSSQIVVYIDPYLSDQLRLLEGEDFRRLDPIYLNPIEIEDATAVLITHIHKDHCDLATIIPIAHSSRKCIFIGPTEVVSHLCDNGIPSDRLIVANGDWITLSPDFMLRSIPAAHPTLVLDNDGNFVCVGYLIEVMDKTIYHSGDTSLTDEIYNALQPYIPIDIVMLPVNERNFYREKRGIIGNMSVRDAFGFARNLKAKTLVPMHWDMFSCNQTYLEEIELIHEKEHPPFELRIFKNKRSWTLV